MVAIEEVEVGEGMRLTDYATYAMLVQSVRAFENEAALLAPRLAGRRVWMLNSTAVGGGVAEMLPRQISLLRQVGVDARWLVLRVDDPRFFQLTKRLHNLVHDAGDPDLGAAERELYEAVSRRAAAELAKRLRPGDVLVVHDPQPMAAGAFLPDDTDVTRIWRCHVGLDERTERTKSVWWFLRTYASGYDRAVFTAPEYFPGYLAGRASVITPALDPLSHKNRELSPHKLVGVLCNAALSANVHPVVTPPFDEPVTRLGLDGTFAPLDHTDDIGLLYRPTVTQISRWDRLKGFLPLLEAFVKLKRRASTEPARARNERRLQLVRLVLAGPEVTGVTDDPEATEVLDELRDRYLALDDRVKRDVAILALPMSSRKVNALVVNALQRCSSVVVQNSFREGFGLTATEAMWKQRAVLASAAVGLRHQVRDRVDGLVVSDAADQEQIEARLHEMLADVPGRDAWGRNGQMRVFEEFLVFPQLQRWLRLLADAADGVAR